MVGNGFVDEARAVGADRDHTGLGPVEEEMREGVRAVLAGQYGDRRPEGGVRVGGDEMGANGAGSPDSSSCPRGR